jgi:hypothetical protein
MVSLPIASWKSAATSDGLELVHGPWSNVTGHWQGHEKRFDSWSNLACTDELSVPPRFPHASWSRNHASDHESFAAFRSAESFPTTISVSESLRT